MEGVPGYTVEEVTERAFRDRLAAMSDDSKPCEACGKPMVRADLGYKVADAYWARRRACSPSCGRQLLRRKRTERCGHCMGLIAIKRSKSYGVHYCSGRCRGLALRKPREAPRLAADGVTASIPLSCGHVAIVDADMLARVSAHSWNHHHGRNHVTAMIDGRTVLLHHFVLGADARLVDHHFGDGLDNRRAVLRPASSTENAWNQKKVASPTTSRFKGVYLHSEARRWNLTKPWAVQIRANGVRRTIGNFATEEEAARAYDSAAREAFGAFACVNFPGPGERCALGDGHRQK